MLLRCNCGYEKSADGHYEDYKCPLCSGKLSENKPEKEMVSLADIVEKDCIDSFKWQINTYGNDTIWYMLERNIHKATTRLHYRKYFLLAGGTIPGEKV